MPGFCHFWRMTPEEFDRLDWSDYAAMCKYMAWYAEQIKRG